MRLGEARRTQSDLALPNFRHRTLCKRHVEKRTGGTNNEVQQHLQTNTSHATVVNMITMASVTSQQTCDRKVVVT